MRTNNMPAETVVSIGLLKWLSGLILFPWLWYEGKRVDALTATLDKRLSEHYTKKEVKEQITLRNQPIIDKLDMIYNKLEKIDNDK